MKNIITIQHTQSLQHTNGMIGSWTDWDLTELGIEQAKRIGERLSVEIQHKQYVMYASDLLRTRHTAEIIARFLEIEPIFTETLREFNFGEAVGKSKEWANKNTMVKTFPNWKTVDEKPFVGSESKREVWNRLLHFQDDIMANAENNFIIISHSGTLSVFFALWLGLDVEMLNRCDLSGNAGGVSFLHEDSDRKRIIRRLNDMQYLRC
ncbi:MAG: phosphoglycerate mutase family protein [Oscillospiraceae bacterium]|jgi:probable phosphoglycerate mutase|nr:phosphoglycerate mutase family protein [Oscillospiraceae bacterium]